MKWQPWQEAMKRGATEEFLMLERSLQQERESYAVLPDNISSRLQQSLYSELQRESAAALERLTKAQTLNFLIYHEDLLER